VPQCGFLGREDMLPLGRRLVRRVAQPSRLTTGRGPCPIELGLGRPAEPDLKALLQLGELKRREELRQHRGGGAGIWAAQPLRSDQGDLRVR